MDIIQETSQEESLKVKDYDEARYQNQLLLIFYQISLKLK